MTKKIFSRPIPKEDGYMLTVDGYDIWVEAPEPVSDDKAADTIQKYQAQAGIVWGNLVPYRKGLFLTRPS